ncbi:MAG: Rieske 2Fe-2S domain-containing protein [Actinomycetes bacterium]
MTLDQSRPPIRDEDVHFPVADPGHEEHIERYSDVDAAAGARAYRQVVTLFGLVPIFAIAFVVIYFAVPRDLSWTGLGTVWNVSNTLLGLTGGMAVLLIGLAAIHWAREIMSDVEVADDRHQTEADETQRAAFLESVNAGIKDAGVQRRGLLLASAGGALGIVVVPALVTLADMGPWPVAALRAETIEKTLWADGVRVVNDANWLPVKASEIEIGQLINAQPENLRELHAHHYQNAKAKAALIVVRMDPNSIQIPESRRDWHVGGILAYSKICTHVGCPISLWEQQTHHLLCPCHQSTFDLGNSGVVVFGPAARSLPQLPIKVDSEGYLVAQSDFTIPVGPSYFERDSRNDFQDGDQ